MSYYPKTMEQQEHYEKIKQLKALMDYKVGVVPIAFSDEVVKHNIYGDFWIYFEAVDPNDECMDMSEKELVKRLQHSMPISMRFVKEKFWEEFAIGYKTETSINWRRVCHGYIQLAKLENWLHNKYFIAWLVKEQYDIHQAFTAQAITAQMMLENEYLNLEPYEEVIKRNKKGDYVKVQVFSKEKANLKLRAISMVLDRHLGKAVVHQVQEVNQNIKKTSLEFKASANIDQSDPQKAMQQIMLEIQKNRQELDMYKIPLPGNKESVENTQQVIESDR